MATLSQSTVHHPPHPIAPVAPPLSGPKHPEVGGSTAALWGPVSLAPRRQLVARTHSAARSHPGRQRADNQDSFLVDNRLGLAIVCDGMGGHAAGARASALATRAFREAIIAGKPLIRGYFAKGDSPQRVIKRDITDLLGEAVHAASRAIYEQSSRHPKWRGMGTTLVAVLLLDNHAFIAHVGDSRAYLLRNGGLERLTRDHTVYDELLRSGHLPPGVLPRSGFRSILTRAVGTEERCQADTLVIDVTRGDRILLCSDGLHQYFEPPEGSPDDLRRELLSPDGQSVADRLLEIANARGGSDDMTAVVLTFGALGEYETDELGALLARHEALSGSPLFSALDEGERASVLSLAEVQTFDPGESILSQDAMSGNVYVLLRGALTVVDLDVGTVELKEGEHVSVKPLPSGAPCSARAVSTQPTELPVIPRQALFTLFRTDPKLAEKVLRQVDR